MDITLVVGSFRSYSSAEKTFYLLPYSADSFLHSFSPYCFNFTFHVTSTVNIRLVDVFLERIGVDKFKDLSGYSSSNSVHLSQ